jgi:hypothetical protein
MVLRILGTHVNLIARGTLRRGFSASPTVTPMSSVPMICEPKSRGGDSIRTEVGKHGGHHGRPECNELCSSVPIFATFPISYSSQTFVLNWLLLVRTPVLHISNLLPEYGLNAPGLLQYLNPWQVSDPPTTLETSYLGLMVWAAAARKNQGQQDQSNEDHDLER